MTKLRGAAGSFVPLVDVTAGVVDPVGVAPESGVDVEFAIDGDRMGGGDVGVVLADRDTESLTTPICSLWIV